MRLHPIMFFSVLLLTVAGCKKTAPGLQVTIAATNLSNVSYGTSSQQNMDIFLPENRSVSATKVMIMIHGGGWTTGDKADFAQFVDTMKRRLPDFAIFNINYRLSASPINLFPTQENDVKAAVQFILGKKGEYLISDKYVLLGASAGGHLAQLQAFKNSAVKPKAVVSFFGICDMADMYNNPVGGNSLISLSVAQAVGKTPAQDPAIYATSSPLNYITASSVVPTIFLHGGADPLVRPTQSTIAKDKVLSVGAPAQYVLYPAGGHGDWDNITYADAFNKVEAFIRLYVL
ncbi:MAG: alpha/beta hydrolase [Chitinophagaceae bacterium]